MPSLRRALAPVAAVVLALSLSGCGDDAQPQADPTEDATSQTTRTREPSQRPSKTLEQQQASDATLSVRVEGDDVSPTAQTIEMDAGDVLTVQVSADRSGELHVHSSPEQYVEFGSGRTRQEIELDKPGQVDIEEHDTGALVARVLVQ